MHAKTERTWWQRNLKWVVLAAVLAGVLLFAAFIAAILFAVVGAMRSSEVYQTALSRAQAHPDVVAWLGQPVEPGLFTSGSIEVNNRSGEADLSIPISGPRGSASISVVATKRAGIWHYEILQVQGPGSDPPPIDLRLPQERTSGPGASR
jgi:hypothetical protein